jgi:hypothetical protein
LYSSLLGSFCGIAQVILAFHHCNQLIQMIATGVRYR